MPHRKELRTNIVILLLAVASMIAIGTLIFSVIEGWSLIDSLYFVTMTATTVGYGDFTPTHEFSKIMTIIYSIAIIPFILYAFSAVAQYQVEGVYRRLNGVESKQKQQEEELEQTERRIAAQKALIKKQEQEIENQERKLNKEVRINREQEEQIESQERKLSRVKGTLKK
ncbi:two pore domain potassium channel family protein [Candidatus Peregrinibacteria bacterium]|nr:MAG: two pore domain potassium channel family protein [Candidatus Peregrinibacteria bacterium]